MSRKQREKRLSELRKQYFEELKETTGARDKNELLDRLSHICFEQEQARKEELRKEEERRKKRLGVKENGGGGGGGGGKKKVYNIIYFIIESNRSNWIKYEIFTT